MSEDLIQYGRWQVENPEYIAGVLQSIPTIYDCISHHKQIHTVDKYPGKGSCYPTAIACMLKLPLADVPNFNLLYFSSGEYQEAQRVLCEKYNTYPDSTTIESKMDQFYNLSDSVIEMWLAANGRKITYVDSDWMDKNPNKPCMVYGKSKRGVMHVVIYMNGKMIHDPHQSNDGIEAAERWAIIEKA